MRYFVTGCTGFIGIHLCRFLLSKDQEVVGLVRNPQKIPPDLRGRLQVIQGDLKIFQNSGIELPPMDVVIHLAGVIAGRNSSDYLEINFEAVQHLLNALNQQKWKPKRLVFASSLAAAGPNLNGVASRETDKPHPIDPYGIAKLKVEQLLNVQPFPTTAFRPPIVLGSGDPATLILYKMANAGFSVLPMGKPQLLSFVYVEDLTRAIWLMSLDNSETHHLYFVTSENPVTNLEIVQKIGYALRKKIRIILLPKFVLKIAMYSSTAVAILFRRRNLFDNKQYKQMTASSFVCTSDLLKTETNWSAKTGLLDAIQMSVDGYRKLKWL
jgi:nucleoside-diphosphate-sugar epimerase